MKRKALSSLIVLVTMVTIIGKLRAHDTIFPNGNEARKFKIAYHGFKDEITGNLTSPTTRQEVNFFYKNDKCSVTNNGKKLGPMQKKTLCTQLATLREKLRVPSKAALKWKDFYDRWGSGPYAIYSTFQFTSNSKDRFNETITYQETATNKKKIDKFGCIIQEYNGPINQWTPKYNDLINPQTFDKIKELYPAFKSILHEAQRINEYGDNKPTQITPYSWRNPLFLNFL